MASGIPSTRAGCRLPLQFQSIAARSIAHAGRDLENHGCLRQFGLGRLRSQRGGHALCVPGSKPRRQCVLALTDLTDVTQNAALE
jgi:hypothetical protein